MDDLERDGNACDGWLIDTNIISAAIANRPLHPGIIHFFENVPDERLRLSVLTIGELRKGIELVSLDSRRRALERKLDELQMQWADRILPIGLDVVNQWGELAARYQSRGQSVPAIDGLIAATACAHNLVVVSHDAFFARMREHVMVYDPLITSG
jgi:predicted nucleic acid-binding protein